MTLPGALDAITRRSFLTVASSTLAAGGLSAFAQQPGSGQENDVQLSQIHAATEQPEKTPGPFEADPQRTGYAIVGLGRLSLNQILPAFAKSKYAKPVALVTGDPAKGRKIAAQYNIKSTSVYGYADFERLADHPEVQAIYIVLPNSMHAEYVLRAAKIKKHILCEKPMATSAADCERMIAACKTANVKLMLAYRQQYEPHNRAVLKLVKEGKLGTLKHFVASNSQDEGDPTQWRLKKALAGGGCLPDVGIYCLNAARFLSGGEPVEVSATIHQPKDDPRFGEVEESCSFLLKFPSGLIASCSTGYGAHKTQFFRLEGDKAWAELSPAFAYTGNKLQWSTFEAPHEIQREPQIAEKDQFALELDHFALCVQQNTEPHTGGEEGLQDQRVIDAIYQSARTGRTVQLKSPAGATRGPELSEEES